MARSISFAPGQWYHCFNRSVCGELLFPNAAAFERFQELLYVSSSVTPASARDAPQGVPRDSTRIFMLRRGPLLVEIAAYALLPNEFHLLMRERMPGGITSFMRRACTGYTLYANRTLSRRGTLFEGTFKAHRVYDAAHVALVADYLHALPARLFLEDGPIPDELLEKRLQAYEYASLYDYAHAYRRAGALLSTEVFIESQDGRLPSAAGALRSRADCRYPRSNRPLWTERPSA